jgi:hypothetical protein
MRPVAVTIEPPTLTQQIDAAVWAASHAEETGRRARMRPGEIDEMRRRLYAAIETLKHLDFMRETL